MSIDFFLDNHCRISGNLTIHGTTLPVTFEGEYAGPRRNPYGDETTVGFSGMTTAKREDFGILWGVSPWRAEDWLREKRFRYSST